MKLQLIPLSLLLWTSPGYGMRVLGLPSLGQAVPGTDLSINSHCPFLCTVWAGRPYSGILVAPQWVLTLEKCTQRT